MFLIVRSPWSNESGNSYLQEPDDDDANNYKVFPYDNVDREALKQDLLALDDFKIIDPRLKPYYADYSRQKAVLNGFTLEIAFHYASDIEDIPHTFNYNLNLCDKLQAMHHDPEIEEYISIAIECEKYLINSWFSIVNDILPNTQSHEIILSNIVTRYLNRYIFSDICSDKHRLIVIYTVYFFMARLGYWFLDYGIREIKRENTITYYRVFKAGQLLAVKDYQLIYMKDIDLYIATL
jgi:hypothetical protein